MIVPKQVELETLKSWLPSRSSLQPYVRSFYKFIVYYMIDHNYNTDTWNIRKQVTGSITSHRRENKENS